MTTNKFEYKQAVLWAPATLLPLAIALLGWLGQTWPAPVQLCAGALALMLFWWGEQWLSYQVRVDAFTLRWRWGLLHPGPKREIRLADVAVVSVGALPDQPRKPIRLIDGVELHGGNFTPALNRGIKIALNDGRTYWVGLNDPEKCAEEIRRFMRENHQQT